MQTANIDRLKARLIYFLYRLALAAGSPIVLLYLVGRTLGNRAYASTLRERLGFLPPNCRRTLPGAVWLHAVSVGEVNSAAVLLDRLGAALPGVPVFVSVGTLAGRALAERRLGGAAGVFYAPLDYAWCVRRALRAVQPTLLVVLETEIWPNLWREARRTGAQLLVLNARISDRAYPRYRRLRWLFGPVLGHAGAIRTQSARDVERYAALGRREGVVDGGNLKYDVRPAAAPPQVAAWIAGLRPCKVWIAASTMPPLGPGDIDEDTVVADAFLELAREHPDLLMIHVPRRPERFDSAARELERRGVRFVRRSALAGLRLPGALLLDTIGELAGLFQFADVVFMGGTLARRGGHNLLEPALFGKAIVSGGNLQNFPEIGADFREAGAMAEIAAPVELARAVSDLLADDARRSELGRRAAALALARSGAADRAVAEIVQWHARGLVVPVPPWWRLPLVPAAWLWRLGTAVDRRMATVRRLGTPVVSVGGIAMGGVGKTPFAIWLASRLDSPAFLTRGYRRRSSGTVVAAPGEAVDPRVAGDEAVLLARSKLGSVGISADRHDAGVRIEAEFRPGVFLLDDGFQHWRLHRDVDIVLVDTLDPFGRGRLFPAGRLREPLSALARADAVVLTRTTPGRGYPAVLEAIRTHTSAPVFRSRVVPTGWIDLDKGCESAAPARPGAFCGLGNPDGFLQTLGGDAVELARFPDHHRYTAADLVEVALRARQAGLDTLATTQKDAANLPPDWRDHMGGVRLLALRIGFEVEEEGALLELVRRLLKR
jgi:tetraacyldisaccharide 4'-kinase